MPEIGSLIDGKYKILSEIGRGGMSVVYMAVNEKANKTWAVKEVRKDGVLDFESVKQGLIAETDMLKILKHPNLPSIIDVIEDHETFLIVMDYIEGNPLSKVLKEDGAQPQEEVIKWAKQLCDVLGYLHSRKPDPIIYRDMKPANIMLKPDGTLTLIDFGTARTFKEKNLADTTCLGTVGYAAPEQFGGMGQTTVRTDIYCLGATLYHLLTGCDPCEPPCEIRPIREINPELSSGLEHIIWKCTQKDPQDRYQSAAELMYALEHYEKIDAKFIKKQKRRLNSFIAVVSMAVVFWIGGISLGIAAKQKATDIYLEKLDEAAKAADDSEKLKLYGECIEIYGKAGEQEAYLQMIKTFKSDLIFTTEEAGLIMKYISNHKEELQKETENYTTVCFELGKLYWYYYDYGNSSNHQITKAKSSIEWFQDVQNYAPDGYPNLNMAKVYANIGIFYRDITTDITEAADKGKYEPFFRNITELLSLVALDENENEIVRLELLELARSALQQYATKFKNDGISYEEIRQQYELISRTLKSVVTTTGTTEKKKKENVSLLKATEKAIITAYGSRGEN